jgi:hypothetical protein
MTRAIQVPKGMDIDQYLKQGDLWATSDGMIRIDAMTPDHKRHALRWLTDNATGLILIMESHLNEEILVGSNPYGLGDVLALMNQRPKEWVVSTALYKALSQ